MNDDSSPEQKVLPIVLDDHENRLRALSRWITCVCVVTFDLDLGQSLEAIFPGGQLSDAEVNNICNLSFPDSNSAAGGDQNFCFRFRVKPRQAKPRQKLDPSKINDVIDSLPPETPTSTAPSSAPNSSSVTTEDDLQQTIQFVNEQTFLFGYVHFRQRRDQTISRGYFQKSVVVVSHLPCVSLFEQVVSILGPLYFDIGSSVVEAALHDISAWVDPFAHAGRHVQLPFVGRVLSLKLPVLYTANNTTTAPPPPPRDRQSRSPKHVSLSSMFQSLHHSTPGWFQEVNLYQAFCSMPNNLWFLWELVITGEPILVMSRSPACCSRAVLALVSSIAPLVYRGDYRPYYTIYDPDFKHYCSLHDIGPSAIPPLILGVTNPFFLKTMENFPHIVIVGVEEDEWAEAGFTAKIVSKMLKEQRKKQRKHRPGMNSMSSSRSSVSRSIPPPPPPGPPPPSVQSIIRSPTDPKHKRFSVTPQVRTGKHDPNVGTGVKDDLSGSTDSLPLDLSASTLPQASSSAKIKTRKSMGLGQKREKNNFLHILNNGPALISDGRPSAQPDKAILKQLLPPSRPPPPLPKSISSSSLTDGVEKSEDENKSLQQAKARYCNRLHCHVCMQSRDFNASNKQKDEQADHSFTINNALLRKIFLQQTQRFLQPFFKYFDVDTATIPPGMSTIYEPEPELINKRQLQDNRVQMTWRWRWNPYLEVPLLPPFTEELFLEDLHEASSQRLLDSLRISPGSLGKSRIARLAFLYKKFFRAPHFYPWFNEQREMAQVKLNNRLYDCIVSLYEHDNIALSNFLHGPLKYAIQMYSTAVKLLRKILSKRGEIDMLLITAIASHVAIIESALPKRTVSALKKTLPKVVLPPSVINSDVRKSERWQNLHAADKVNKHIIGNSQSYVVSSGNYLNAAPQVINNHFK